MGYVHEGKGQDVLVATLPELVKQLPRLLVVFVGDDTSAWAASLKAKVEAMGGAAHVRFAGVRSDSYAFIRAADLLVHPTRTEGQGLVLLEATMLRTPVLAANVGGVPSVITHGETGWLVQPNDVGALRDGILTLAENVELRAALAGRAAEVYWKSFNRSIHRTRLLDIVDRMLSGLLERGRA